MAMMQFLGEWIKHIVLLILMASFLELILPNSSIKRYVKLVVGLLLILLILSPILYLFRFDYERMMLSIDRLLEQPSGSIEMQIEEKTERIEGAQVQSILEAVVQEWAGDIKKSIEQNFTIKVEHILLYLGIHHQEPFVEKLELFLTEASSRDGPQTKENPDAIKPIQPIEIQINPHRRAEKQAEQTEAQKKLDKLVLNLLKDEWNISVDKISIAWTGGDHYRTSNLE
jgi:stage III sporulation protein AF